MKINYNRLGLNINYLRRKFDQTLLDLANDTGISVTALSQYETGTVIPPRDRIIIIAKHFRITENELIFGDYSNSTNIASLPVNNKKRDKIMFEKMLPLICTDKAMENENFKTAFNTHKLLYDLILSGEDFDIVKYNLCLEFYKKSREEGITEGTANHLWLLMFLGFFLSIVNSSLLNAIKSLHGKEGTMKDIIDGILYSVCDEEDKENKMYADVKKEFVKENQADMKIDIALLKKSKKYADLGDYFLAFMYVFGLIENDKTPEANSSVGYEMLYIFKILGNPYVKNLSTPTIEG